MPLEKNVEHEPVLVDRPPEPVANPVDTRTHLVKMPQRTPTGFFVAQVFREEGFELDAPLAESLMVGLNTTLVQQFLDVTVTQRKAMIKPNGVLNDGHGKR